MAIVATRYQQGGVVVSNVHIILVFASLHLRKLLDCHAMERAYPKIRLYVHSPLAEGERVRLDKEQAHYVAHVMRQKEGDVIACFNGSDGDWSAVIESIAKKEMWLCVQQVLRPYRDVPDIWLLFAPIKQGRIDYMIEKATEMGVARLVPVRSDYTMVSRINEERLMAHCVEAAEQTERQDVPVLDGLKALESVLGDWDENRILFYGDESGVGLDVRSVLGQEEGKHARYALLIGPEGGFSPKEHALLRSLSFVRPISMGPRVLRADTAAIAGLACLQLWLGDWHYHPRFRSAQDMKGKVYG